MKLCVYSYSKLSNQLIVELDNNSVKVFFSFGCDPLNRTESLSESFPNICENDYVFVSNNSGLMPYFFSNNVKANYCFSLEGLYLLTKKAKSDGIEFTYNQKNTLIYRHMQRITLLNYSITPLIISDNGLDEYMFLVDDGSSKFLITKDIYPQAFIGQKKNKNAYYFKEVDYFIFNDFFYQNNKLSTISEREEQLQAMEVIERNKCNFAFCNSSDLHHIANLYHILDSSYTFITTSDIKVLLETSDNCTFLPQFKSSYYRFNKVKTIDDFNINQLKKIKFLMVLDSNVKHLDLIKQFEPNKIGLINCLSSYFYPTTFNNDSLLMEFINNNDFLSIYSNDKISKITDFKKLFNYISVSKNYICFQSSLNDEKSKFFNNITFCNDSFSIDVEKNQKSSKKINLSSFDKAPNYEIQNKEQIKEKEIDKEPVDTSILNYKDKIAEIRNKYKTQQFQETSHSFDVTEYIKGYKHKTKENDIKNNIKKQNSGNSIDGF